MKILMISIPFSGHINPLLGLCKEFVDKGHDVTFILNESWRESVCKTGAKFVTYDNFPDNPTPFQLRKSSFKAAYNTGLRIGKNFDIIVYEMLFFLGKSLSDKLELPCVRLFSTFALNNEILNNFINTGGPLMRLFKSKLIRKRITKSLIGDIKIKNEDLLSEISQNIPDLNFVFTTREFQIDDEKFPNNRFKFIGSSIMKRESNIDIPFEKLTHPLIYISLGSMLNNFKSFYKKCIQAFKDENVSVIMSVGNKIKIERLGDIPENFKIYPFVPQLKVLEKADLFITHGGMNSVNEALYYGARMVVMPLATDQPTVASRIEDLNLGKRLYGKFVSASCIQKTALSVLSDKIILDNIKKFQMISQKAKGIQFAANEIEKYLKVKGE